MCQCGCQGVGHCCLGPKQTPVRPPAHGETGRAHSGDIGWMVGKRKTKGEEGKCERKKKGRLKEKD